MSGWNCASVPLADTRAMAAAVRGAGRTPSTSAARTSARSLARRGLPRVSLEEVRSPSTFLLPWLVGEVGPRGPQEVVGRRGRTDGVDLAGPPPGGPDLGLLGEGQIGQDGSREHEVQGVLTRERPRGGWKSRSRTSSTSAGSVGTVEPPAAPGGLCGSPFITVSPPCCAGTCPYAVSQARGGDGTLASVKAPDVRATGARALVVRGVAGSSAAAGW